MNPKYAQYGTPLIKLIEECSEVIQALCKADRFGLDHTHPKEHKTNRQLVKSEIKDLELAIKNYKHWHNSIPEGSDIKVRE